MDAKQVFQMIFTSPSSAKGDIDMPLVIEALASPGSYRQRRKPSSKCPSVTVQLGMDGQVTARAIAYAAVVACSDNLYINLRKFWQLKSISGNTMWPVRNNYLKRK